VLEEAQHTLKHKFGLELYELRVKSKGSTDIDASKGKDKEDGEDEGPVKCRCNFSSSC
jgi:hypothetical protein